MKCRNIGAFKKLLIFMVVSALLAAGCAPAKPVARPRIYHDLGQGNAYLESSSGRQERRCGPACVLGFELGKSTYVDVKAKLPRGANPKNQYYGNYGPFFLTDGAAYGIPGLQSVAFSFDRRWKLASVTMAFSEQGFAAYKKRLDSQYRLYREMHGETTIYQANPDEGASDYYFGDYIVASETYNEHYGRIFYSVNFTTTLPFDLTRKMRTR